MNLDEYQKAALRTAGDGRDTIHVAVAGLGLAGEAGEVVEILKKYIGHGHHMPTERFAKELGDVMWYVAVLAHHFGISLSEVAEANVRKLRERYPDGFSSEASRNREEE